VNLRLMDDAQPDQRFEDQLAAMVKARDDGLIGGIGVSNVSLDHLRYALAITDIACVQNLMNLSDRRSMPILEECHAAASPSCLSSRSVRDSPAAIQCWLAHR
jgi:pyridoxine 4-dehydrogenase